MSNLEKFNRFFAQWLFFRLAKFKISGKKYYGYCILYPVLPLTGWDSDYRPKKQKRIVIKDSK